MKVISHKISSGKKIGTLLVTQMMSMILVFILILNLKLNHYTYHFHKQRIYVKSYGETIWIHFLIKNFVLLKGYNDIWNEVS